MRKSSLSIRARLFSIPGVVSVGWGYKIKGGKQLGRECLVVGVERKRRLIWPRHKVPVRIEGFETDVVEVGKIVAPPPPEGPPLALQDRKGKWRPAPGGVSIGHPQITAGTLACLVRVKGKQGWRILSNNHVLANSNAGRIGDPIYQPGVADGGAVAHTIAKLEAFEPINFGGAPNYADCAIALPAEQMDVSPDILDIGLPVGYTEAELGLRVRKSGRTTGVNENFVQQVNAVAQVTYPGGRQAYFEDQIITGYMAAGGDSGSVVLDMQNRIVGLLFAGSDQITVVSPFKHVVDALDLDIGGEPPPDGLSITAFYKFSDDADWTIIGRMGPSGFEYQLTWSIPKEGICRLRYAAEEGGVLVGEAETGDFTIDFAEPGVEVTPIYPKGGETIEAKEITLRIRVERI